ncbi:MAG: hypothetical protein R3E08_03315 [Thiotrichaceae bacterium]
MELDATEQFVEPTESVAESELEVEAAAQFVEPTESVAESELEVEAAEQFVEPTEPVAESELEIEAAEQFVEPTESVAESELEVEAAAQFVEPTESVAESELEVEAAAQFVEPTEFAVEESAEYPEETGEFAHAVALETMELNKLLDEEIFEGIPDITESESESVMFSDELSEIDDDFQMEDFSLSHFEDEEADELATLKENNIHQEEEPIVSPQATEVQGKITNPVEVNVIPTHMIYAAQHNETLNDLSNKIVEVSDMLSEALHQLVTAENDSEAFLTAVEEYTNTMQILWERAEKARLGGLQRVCTFISDNVFELSVLPKSERFKYLELLSACPQLMLDYVQNSRVGSTTLVEHLSQPQWLQPLPREQSDGLAVQLRQEAIILQIEQPAHMKRIEASVEQVKLQEATTVAQLLETAQTEEKIEEIQDNDEAQPLDKLQSTSVVTVAKETETHDEFIFSDEMPEDEDAFLVNEHLDFTVKSAVSESDDREELADDKQIFSPEQEIVEPVLVSPVTEMLDHSEVVETDATDTEDTELSLEDISSLETQFLEEPDLAELHEESPSVSLVQPVDSEEKVEVTSLSDDAISSLESEENLQDELLEATVQDDETIFAEHTDLIEELSEPTSQLNEFEAESSESEMIPVAVSVDANHLGDVADMPLINPDMLDNLLNELSEAMDDLHKALNKFAIAENDSAELLEAVEQYTDNVQSIAEAADNVGLHGLSEVCAFVNENIYELSTQPHAIRRTAQPHLDEWSRLIRDYVSHPQSVAPQLIVHLSNFTWPFPLDEARAATLLERLTHQQSQEMSAALEVDATELTEVQPVETIDIQDETSETIDEVVLAEPVVLHRIQRQLTQSNHILLAALGKMVEAEDGSEDLLMAVGEYTESVQSIWDVAEVYGLKGLQEVCSIVNDNVMAMSAEDKPTRLAAQAVFADWLPDCLTYLQQPSVGALQLINHLQNPLWLLPPDNEQLIELHQNLLTPSTKEVETAPPESTLEEQVIVTESVVDVAGSVIDAPEIADIVLADPDILMVLEGQLLDSGEQLAEILIKLVNAEDGSEDLLMAASEYTESVQTVWDTAEMAGLAGVQEICSFINDNVMTLGTQDKTARIASQDLFSHWIPLISEYLQHPRRGAEQLVQHLQHPLWATPLSTQQAVKLQQLLLQQPETSQPILSPSQEIATDEIEIAAPEVIELLQTQVHESSAQLSEILQRVVSVDDGSEDLLMAVGEYTEAVQAIWDAAEMAQLSGLQDVCSFVNDNVMALSVQEKSARTASQALFLQWVTAIETYLQTPRAGASHLFNLLQNPQWANPLSRDQAKH